MAEAALGLEVLQVRPLPAGMGVVIVAVRDELTHLPHFLRHHGLPAPAASPSLTMLQ